MSDSLLTLSSGDMTLKAFLVSCRIMPRTPTYDGHFDRVTETKVPANQVNCRATWTRCCNYTAHQHAMKYFLQTNRRKADPRTGEGGAGHAMGVDNWACSFPITLILFNFIFPFLLIILQISYLFRCLVLYCTFWMSLWIHQRWASQDFKAKVPRNRTDIPLFLFLSITCFIARNIWVRNLSQDKASICYL